ncbi:hypothetical protein [Streptomyces sp. MMS24-I29]|uniref:hypothetical protein n=1 Tax=Streptomyces sp. MMS24-I29 TaxID=3351480 RepID=UPI003C79968D
MPQAALALTEDRRRCTGEPHQALHALLPDTDQPLTIPAARHPEQAQLEAAVFLACCEIGSLVHRVKFVSEGNQRVMMLGTELPHVGTDWDFELADCTVDEHGRLITPVVTCLEATRAAKAQTPVPQPRTEKTEGPVQIGALTRLIYHAVHKQETDAARQLRDTARLQLPRCEGQALEHLQRAIDHANDWIHQQDRARRRLFNRLDEAIRYGHDRNVSTLIPQVRKHLLGDAAATPQEAATLQAADAFLEEALRRAARERRAAKELRAAEARTQEARQAAAEEERRARRAAAREERRTRREAEAQERENQPVTQALGRKARNKARGRVQSITGRLRREALSTEQLQELVEELVVAAKEAGDILSPAEQNKVKEWAERSPSPQKSRTRPKPRPRSRSRSRTSSRALPRCRRISCPLRRLSGEP